MQPREPGVGRAPFDVVAMVASAGGLGALSVVLRELSVELPAAVVVAMHLGAESLLAELLAKRTSLPVVTIESGMGLRPGVVHVCPPRARLELLPDGSCALHASDNVVRDRPFDGLLSSLADSYGMRGMAVVLTGMGRDASAGARMLKQAGGAVLAQSEDSAEFADMPRAVVESGAVDIVQPLQSLGRTVASLAFGGSFPQPRNEAEACEALFAGPGPARHTLRDVTWENSTFGPVRAWSDVLKTTASLVLQLRFPACIFWGVDFAQLYNDGWIDVLGVAHPAAAGAPARTSWSESRAPLASACRRVHETGEPSELRDQQLAIGRGTFVQEAYYTFSITPLLDDQGSVAGVLTVASASTKAVLATRRMALLRALGGSMVASVPEECERTLGALAEVPQEIPFALLYTVEDGARAQAVLRAHAGVTGKLAPASIERAARGASWPVFEAFDQNEVLRLDDLAQRFPGFSPGPWPEPSTSAWLLPLASRGGPASAVLIVGLSSRLQHDHAYLDFVSMLASQIGKNLTDAQARQRDRTRLAELAELDQQKTMFFSNVSHEFRTPLTLLLGPLENLLHVRAQLPGELAEEVEQAARNGRWLHHLVDTLLDFSQIEAGRLYAVREPLDLAELTIELTGLFRSAIARAGLHLQVDCAPIQKPVWVDRTMWEKIVSNLLSNALKFTFEGRITVTLRELSQHVELTVADTGVGIPEAQQSEIFKRFHRVRGTRARTQEGAGIGLSLVHELLRLHNGRARVHSRPGEGSTFKVWLPTGRPVGVKNDAVQAREQPRTARALAAQAERWSAVERLPDAIVDSTIGPPRQPPAGLPIARILFVDDNVEMRTYIKRLLAERWHVEVASNGREALELARALRPDLILTDVMMPHLDGFALLRAIRDDHVLRATPVVLVTARADEEAALDGLRAGADDYIAKPFSARELIARTGAQLELARTRRQGEQRMRALLALMPAGVYACDADGKLSFCNRRAIELWGREPASDTLRCLGGDFACEGDSAMMRALRDGEPVVERPLSWLRPDGTRLELTMNVSPLRAGDGTLMGAVNVFHDVSELKRAHVALEALNRELEQRVAQRTAAVEESRARQAFLLALGDALREAKGLQETEAVACAMLREHLGADAVYYVESELDDSANIRSDAHSDGVDSVAGSYDAMYTREIRRGVRAGRGTLVVHDIARWDCSEQIRELCRSRSIFAFALIELETDARTRVWLTVAYSAPHQFSEYELQVHREVTERMGFAMEASRALRLLKDSETRFRLALRTAQAGVFEWIVASDVVYADERARELMGVSPDQPLTSSLMFERVPAEERAHVGALMREVLDPAMGRFDAEHGLTFPNGVRRVRVSAEAVVEGDDAARKVVRVIGTLFAPNQVGSR